MAKESWQHQTHSHHWRLTCLLARGTGTGAWQVCTWGPRQGLERTHAHSNTHDLGAAWALCSGQILHRLALLSAAHTADKRQKIVHTDSSSFSATLSLPGSSKPLEKLLCLSLSNNVSIRKAGILAGGLSAHPVWKEE